MFRERPEKVLEAFQRREKARQVLCRWRRWTVAGWRPPPMFDSERLGSGCLFREGLRETIRRSEVSKALGGSETGIRSIVRRSRDSGAQSDGSGGQTLAARGSTSTLTELGCGLAASSGGSTEVGFSRSARWLPCGHPMRGAQRPRAGKRPTRLIGNFGAGQSPSSACPSRFQAWRAVIRTVLLSLRSLGKIRAAASAVPILARPMIAAHWRCSSSRWSISP